MNRIICLGNRFFKPDSAGLSVFDYLANMNLPANVELIEAGLEGLDVLRHLEGAKRVILVDAVDGFGTRGEVVILSVDEIVSGATFAHGHSLGLAYALAAMPHVLEDKTPIVQLVGIEGEFNELSIAQAAGECIALVSDPNPNVQPKTDRGKESRA